MNNHRLFVYLFGSAAFLFTDVVAREAIVGGEIAEAHDFRYQVTILVADCFNLCGGGILHKRFVLTAAHCVIRVDGELLGKPMSILAGTADLFQRGTVIEVETVFAPLEYGLQHGSIHTGDIAVLKLQSSLDMLSHGFAWLHLQTTLYPHKEGMAKIAGFGWDKIGEKQNLIGYYSDSKLRFATAEIRNRSQCQHDHPSLMINDKYLCARVVASQRQHAEKPRGVCLGDNGGPLVVNIHVVIGVLSRIADNCSEKSSSGLYTRVSHYRRFILNVMENKSHDNMFVAHV